MRREDFGRVVEKDISCRYRRIVGRLYVEAFQVDEIWDYAQKGDAIQISKGVRKGGVDYERPRMA
jgi:hypothetical protein